MLVARTYRGTLLDRHGDGDLPVAPDGPISFLVYIIVGQYVLGFQLGWCPRAGLERRLLAQSFYYARAPDPGWRRWSALAPHRTAALSLVLPR